MDYIGNDDHPLARLFEPIDHPSPIAHYRRHRSSSRASMFFIFLRKATFLLESTTLEISLRDIGTWRIHHMIHSSTRVGKRRKDNGK